MNKVILILVAIIILLAGAVAYFLWDRNPDRVTEEENSIATSTQQVENKENNEPLEGPTTIGSSVDGREIIAHRYGTGEKHLVFVGGIHGGYSWNTVLVAYELMDYLENNRAEIPENVRVTVIPVLNPDALQIVVNADGRFKPQDVSVSAANTIESRLNANGVDLNRNFDCDWQETGTWQSRDVSGGDRPFSEPESEAFRNFVNSNEPSAVLVWYSAAGGVFASSCHNDVSDETRDLTRIFAEAS
ncbi:MAG: M14 family metallopeptidase, partial [Candidatus Paceibacterota bacterium]